MQTVLIVIHLLVVVALIVVVLLQRSEGGALGIGGGGVGGFFTGRGQSNALTRATAILATIFFLTSIALTVAASLNRSGKSIFENFQPAATAPAKPGEVPAGGLLNELQKLQDQKSGAPAQPAAPATPAPPRSQ
ncbi:MAG: preprotein translocase subunit SecG [Hyphomicrobiales bacterium]|nr:preprotein translocase subunit SecG [Hyphomicrobiales bacterium]